MSKDIRWHDEYNGKYVLSTTENGIPTYTNSKTRWIERNKGNSIWWEEDNNWVIGQTDNLGKKVRVLTTNDISKSAYLHEVPAKKWYFYDSDDGGNEGNDTDPNRDKLWKNVENNDITISCGEGKYIDYI